MEEMFTILPLCCRFMTGVTAWQKRNVPSRLKAMRRCHSAKLSSSTLAPARGMMVLPPTALTRMSMRPSSRTTLSTTPPTWSGSRASAWRPCARPPDDLIASTVASSLVLSVSTATTIPPSAPMMSAVARPMPLAAAVMSATRSVNRMVPPLGCPLEPCDSGSLSWVRSGHGRGRRRRVRDADRRVGLERAQEAELLADLAHGGQHFEPEHPDALLRILVAHEAVARPEADDGRARLLEESAKLRDDRFGRPRDDLLVADLVLEGRGPGIGAAAHRELHEGLAVRRREIARRRRPHGMGEARELALHPHELSRVGHGLLFRVGDVAALEIAAVLGSRRVPRLGGHRVIELPDLLGRVDGRAQRDIRVTLAGRPDDGLLAEDTGNPDSRVRLLERNGPGVDHAVLVARPLEPEGPRLRPRANDQLVRLLEALTIVSGVDARRELLLATAADEARDEAALGDHVDHGKLFGQAHGIVRSEEHTSELQSRS